MKTSNKILSMLLLIGFGFLVFSQLALRAKYLDNDVTNPEEYNAYFYKDYSPGNIKYVRLFNVSYCQVVPSGIAKLRLDKSNSNFVKYLVSADTLFINYDDSSTKYSQFVSSKLVQNIKLFLPNDVHIYASNSTLDANGAGDEQARTKWNFNLKSCVLFTRNQSFTDSSKKYFDTLFISAEKSRVYLFRKDHFNTININLDHSFMDDGQAVIGKANLIADSSTLVVLAAKNINKINSTIIKN